MIISQSPCYSVNEELANTISHGLGALLSVAGLTFLVTYAALMQDARHVISFAIYGASLVSLFLASTLYHAVANAQLKQVFKLLDHCAIYVLIAGTYTPLMLVTLSGTLGYSMLVLVWLCALAGILFKVKFGQRFKLLSVTTYLLMGGISLTIINQLQTHLSGNGFALLVTGGAIYAAGVIFYLMKTIPFTHAIWHLFVLGGAGSHFFMMLLYV
jgi:hemolysin III